ncbi:hypothetical protein CWI84_00660 [Idiomarina tyrosinivorans]|uniref:DUF4405 domain-containing protein n=2 Tax=Idiomarina tyrosinivorans TaxID=1445662 RepID=A0A432ZU49_9GAMM|nr:hypothetical protein CWI84_00660 [Idiomarina tyrosinivorans]
MLLAVIMISVVSGCLMIPTLLEFKLQMAVDWRLSGSQRLWTVSFHVLASIISLILMGALWQVHMKLGWRKQQHRGSGTFCAISLVVMAVTGVGLYYLSQLDMQLWTALAHTALGLAFTLAFLLHLLFSIRSRR